MAPTKTMKNTYCKTLIIGVSLLVILVIMLPITIKIISLSELNNYSKLSDQDLEN